jgi:DNA-binding CsgD family transcriptional regulator
MGNNASAVLLNCVLYSDAPHFRERPAWTYYTEVSVSAPPSNALVGRSDPGGWSEASHLTHGLEGQASRDLPEITGKAEQSVATRKCENKQWGPWSLTQSELEVIQLLAEGTTNSEISSRLFISPKTTKNHLAAIFQKLDVTNRTQALVRAVSMGLVSID